MVLRSDEAGITVAIESKDCGTVLGAEWGVLKASLAHFVSTRVEKPLLLRSVRARENEGESIRSAVSSKRWRSFEAVCEEEGSATPLTPDSRRTCSSSSVGGSKQDNHFFALR